MEEKRIRTEVIRFRVNKETKEQFNNICKDKCINQSELLRTLLEQWCSEQQDRTLNRRQKTDKENI